MKKVFRKFTSTTLFILMLSAAVPAFAASTTSESEWTGLEKSLEPIIEKAKTDKVTMGITVKDLSGTYNNTTVNVGNMGPYKAASTIKLGLASLIMKGVDEQKWSLDTKIMVNPADIVAGSGTLQNDGATAFPQNITLGRLMRLMITVSDNTATNVLIDFIGRSDFPGGIATNDGTIPIDGSNNSFDTMNGFAKVNTFTHSLGLVDSGFHLGRKMMLSHTADQENMIAPDEDAKLLDMIYNSTFLSRASSSQIISWMRQQQVNTKFGAVIPRTYLANKTGENTDVSHDTGYILVNGHEVAISIMTSFNPSDFADWDTAFNTANSEVQNAAKNIYDYITKPSINVISQLSTKITGKVAEPGTTVIVKKNIEKIGTTTARKDGSFSIKLAKKLSVGTNLTLSSVDKDGNIVGSITTKVVDKVAPTIPTVNKITYKTTYVTGKGEKGATIYIYKGKKLIAKTTVGKKGTYSIKISKQKKGSNLTLYATDKAGNKSKTKTVKVH